MTGAERLKKRFKGGVPHIAKKEKVKKDKMKPLPKALQNNKNVTPFKFDPLIHTKAYPYND